MHYYTDVLKKYGSFQGRARRREYWMFALFNGIIVVVLVGLAAATKSTALYVLYAAYILAVVIPSVGLLVRRLHDTGRSGGWFFITFVPFVGGLVLFIFMVLEGNRGPNEYGPDPKGADVYPGAAGPYAG
ncbi:DUF805 domain-containing protein [Streptomyces sp. NPDC048200]|uniref:DUF805 domain-containing protein n=1 Tax=Streptomyces sp. NPDC048200 TaxID=3365512 RepID=UPI00371079A7